MSLTDYIRPIAAAGDSKQRPKCWPSELIDYFSLGNLNAPCLADDL